MAAKNYLKTALRFINESRCIDDIDFLVAWIQKRALQSNVSEELVSTLALSSKIEGTIVLTPDEELHQIMDTRTNKISDITRIRVMKMSNGGYDFEVDTLNNTFGSEIVYNPKVSFSTNPIKFLKA